MGYFFVFQEDVILNSSSVQRQDGAGVEGSGQGRSSGCPWEDWLLLQLRGRRRCWLSFLPCGSHLLMVGDVIPRVVGTSIFTFFSPSALASLYKESQLQ